MLRCKDLGVIVIGDVEFHFRVLGLFPVGPHGDILVRHVEKAFRRVIVHKFQPFRQDPVVQFQRIGGALHMHLHQLAPVEAGADLPGAVADGAAVFHGQGVGGFCFDRNAAGQSGYVAVRLAVAVHLARRKHTFKVV